jgi:RNA polymerase sigma factor (sigma-70 family)
MAEIPTTRASLLFRIRDGRDGLAWSEFVEVYGPLVYAYGRRHGLQDADAADLTQDVLLAVAGAVGKFAYDPARGLFRSWLLTVARTKLSTLRGRLARQDRGSGDTATANQLDELPDRAGDDPDAAEWDRDYQQRLFEWAAEKVRAEFTEKTWQAFWRTAVEHATPADVAAAVGLSVGAVYMARSRVTSRLREYVEWARCDDERGERTQ